MRVDDKKYACFEYEDGHGHDGEVKDNPFQRGDVVIKPIGTDENLTPEIGVVLQVHDSSELRTDMFGNECVTRLRLATEEEIRKYRPRLLGLKLITKEAIQSGNEYVTEFNDGITIKGNINSLKNYVIDVNSAINGTGNELPNYITDLFFAIEAEYQAFYNLDPNNWDKVEAGDTVLELGDEE